MWWIFPTSFAPSLCCLAPQPCLMNLSNCGAWHCKKISGTNIWGSWIFKVYNSKTYKMALNQMMEKALNTLVQIFWVSCHCAWAWRVVIQETDSAVSDPSVNLHVCGCPKIAFFSIFLGLWAGIWIIWWSWRDSCYHGQRDWVLGRLIRVLAPSYLNTCIQQNMWWKNVDVSSYLCWIFS